MIITHNIPWDKCLSKQLFPAIEKGWSNEGRPTHFFWGLAGKNIRGIKECIEKNEERWYVDVGYLTQQITNIICYCNVFSITLQHRNAFFSKWFNYHTFCSLNVL